MKRIQSTVLLVILLGAVALSGRQLVRVFLPSPRQVVAENQAMQAALATVEMDYARASLLYAETDSDVISNPLHRRLHARALAHLGSWEEAARLVAEAGADTVYRGAALADAERLRALDAGRMLVPEASGTWERLIVRFGQEEGVGAVAVLEDGRIVTAHPSAGAVTVWSSEGNRLRRFRGLGMPVSLAVDGEAILVADMAGGRALRLDPADGMVRDLTLPSQPVSGIRGVAPSVEGTFWIIDFGGGRCLRVDAEGREVASFGAGDLDRPSAILADGPDLLVAEAGKDRVVRFDQNGRLVRAYVHPRLGAPVALASAPGGFLILGGNGLVFWARSDEEDVQGPLPTPSSLLQAGTLGLAADRDGNILWGDGRSLRWARRLPEDRPRHLLEILRVEASRGTAGTGQLMVTASVMDKSGLALRALEAPQFRLIRGQERILPLRVENLSTDLAGRRMIIAMEQSDAIHAHTESVLAILEFVLADLDPADKAAVLDLRDSWTMVRDFTGSFDLVRAAIREERSRVATLDLAPVSALHHAILLLAPTDYARAILWVTSGEGVDADRVKRIRRMGLINQVPIFILHVGSTHRDLLTDLASRTGGRCFPLYDNATARELPRALGEVRSGRYRISAEVELPLPQHRGRWFDVTLESYHLDAVAWDRSGYISY